MFTSRRDALCMVEESESNFEVFSGTNWISLEEIRRRDLLPALLLCDSVEEELATLSNFRLNWRRVVFLTGVERAEDWVSEACSYGLFKSILVGGSTTVDSREVLAKEADANGMAICFLPSGLNP